MVNNFHNDCFRKIFAVLCVVYEGFYCHTDYNNSIYIVWERSEICWDSLPSQVWWFYIRVVGYASLLKKQDYYNVNWKQNWPQLHFLSKLQQIQHHCKFVCMHRLGLEVVCQNFLNINGQPGQCFVCHRLAELLITAFVLLRIYMYI